MTKPGIDYAVFRNTKYFPSLDALRALSVFLVMFNHVHGHVPSWINGTLGVDVFFVLSGFLITTLLLRERERQGRVSLGGFYTRRFFRIIPVYLFTVLLYFAAVHATHDHTKAAQFKAALPWLLTFLQEYRPAAAGNILGHAWTLGIEEKFYIIWPLLLIGLYPFRRRALLCLAALFIAIALLPHIYARSYGGLLIGAVLAIALSASGRRPAIAKVFTSIPDPVLCVLLAGTYLLNRNGNEFVLLFSGAVALLVASLVLRGGLLRRVLETPVLVYIGKRSYAMYLIHVLVLDFVEKIQPAFMDNRGVLIVCVAYSLTLGGASLMYVAIERPCIALGRSLSTKVAQRALTEAHPDGAPRFNRREEDSA
jgi:peptidoglycan/LPS O-acetylase OafA/YrhL